MGQLWFKLVLFQVQYIQSWGEFETGLHAHQMPFQLFVIKRLTLTIVLGSGVGHARCRSFSSGKGTYDGVLVLLHHALTNAPESESRWILGAPAIEIQQH